MKHLTVVNHKAARVERHVRDSAPPLAQIPSPSMPADQDVVALQDGGTQPPVVAHLPLGCSLVFSPGWEADRTGGTAGLCQPVERDLFDCHIGCYWPAQVPDQLNHAPDWTSKCAAAQKDWRKIDLIFP
jgi:hypothetical protein